MESSLPEVPKGKFTNVPKKGMIIAVSCRMEDLDSICPSSSWKSGRRFVPEPAIAVEKERV
jgi:hypothetical protein